MNQPELAQPAADRPGDRQSGTDRPGTPSSAGPVALGLIPANVPGAFLPPRPPEDFDLPKFSQVQFTGAQCSGPGGASSDPSQGDVWTVSGFGKTLTAVTLATDEATIDFTG